MEVVTDVPLSLFTEHFHKGRTFVLSLYSCILPRTTNLDVTIRNCCSFTVLVKQNELSPTMMSVEVTLWYSHFCIPSLFLRFNWLRALVFLQNIVFSP